MKHAFLHFWQQRNPREQRTLRLGAIVLALLLGYALLWYPLQQEYRRLQQELPVLRQAKAQMAQHSDEINRLKNQPIPPRASNLSAAMAQASQRSGQTSPREVQTLDPGHLRIVYESTPFESWLAWSKVLQSESRIRIASADIRALPEPGMVRIEAVLALPGAP